MPQKGKESGAIYLRCYYTHKIKVLFYPSTAKLSDGDFFSISASVSRYLA